MSFRAVTLNLGLILLLAATVNLVVIDARSWDLAVTVGQDIVFLTQNGSQISRSIVPNATKLSAIAYDDDTNTMFLSDGNSRGFVLFSVDLRAKNLTVQPILKRDKDSPILSMAFDAQTRTLFWTTKWSIVKMMISRDGKSSNPQILHRFEMESARDIALDSCNRRIYWATSNHSAPSIMRSNFDGSDMTTLVTNNLYEPTSIAVDHINSRLYWIDDEEGIHYKMETSNLDGSDRTIIVHGTHQVPLHLAVDRNNLYWTETVYKAVWTVSKESQAGDVPKEFQSYYDRQVDPTSILVRDNIGKGIDCKAMKVEEIKRTAMPAPTTESIANLTSVNEELGEKNFCANGGTVDGANCRCMPGYTGSRCEISACHNYCLQGECFINSNGMPVCKCDASHSGLRCERDSAVGTTSSCSCGGQLNQTVEDIIDYDSFNCTILVPLLAALTGMLAIVVIVLSFYVNRLRRRPRVKKRFVVNKGGGIAPLTSRPSQLSTDQCEITIENCCNMNICETPCFEPKLRSSNTRSNGTKKEEKSNLLDNMDGNNSC